MQRKQPQFTSSYIVDIMATYMQSMQRANVTKVNMKDHELLGNSPRYLMENNETFKYQV